MKEIVKGDIIWIDCAPVKGSEQDGRRPALVLSVPGYNAKTGLAVIAPITNQAKGYPFEVVIPHGLKVEGVVLADHIKCLDTAARKAQFICKAPPSVVDEAIKKFQALIGA